MKAPRCKCGERCQFYGPIGGYSVQCKGCNAKQSEKRRAASRRRIAAARYAAAREAAARFREGMGR